MRREGGALRFSGAVLVGYPGVWRGKVQFVSLHPSRDFVDGQVFDINAHRVLSPVIVLVV